LVKECGDASTLERTIQAIGTYFHLLDFVASTIARRKITTETTKMKAAIISTPPQDLHQSGRRPTANQRCHRKLAQIWVRKPSPKGSFGVPISHLHLGMLRVYTSDASMAGFDSAQKIAFAKVGYCGTVLQPVDASVLVVVYVMAVPAKPLHFLFHCRYRV
jgi:hypothetical protein